MLTAVQGVIQNDRIQIDSNELKAFNGRTVTVIINDIIKPAGSKQDKTKFFDAVGKVDIDKGAVDELRAASMI